MTVDSAFPLGSLTKPFTAALALLVVFDDELGLDTPLVACLPGVGTGLDDRITLRQLLSHTSGLPSEADHDPRRRPSRARWVSANCRRNDLVHPPGTVFSYSNTGYIVAGHVVELITGLEWRAAVEAILLPLLGITADPQRPAVAGHSMGAGPGRVRPVPVQPHHGLEAPAGALAMSAADLLALALAEPVTGELLAEARRDQVVRLPGPFGLADGWGLGWAVYRRGGVEWIGHDGTGEGTSCHLRYAPGHGTAVALTTNSTTGTALWDDLVTWLRSAGIDVGSHPRTTPEDAGPPIAGDPGCAGRYVNGESELVVMAGSDGALAVSINGQPGAALTSFSGSRFSLHPAARGAPSYAGRFVYEQKTDEVILMQVGGRTARRERGER